MNGMSEQELREMVRASIARVSSASSRVDVDLPVPDGHASFARLPLVRGGDGDGACLIEPSVRCNHCGYCLSYGH
jgi:hypothetical protein